MKVVNEDNRVCLNLDRFSRWFIINSAEKSIILLLFSLLTELLKKIRILFSKLILKISDDFPNSSMLDEFFLMMGPTLYRCTRGDMLWHSLENSCDSKVRKIVTFSSVLMRKLYNSIPWTSHKLNFIVKSICPSNNRSFWD